MRIVRLAVLALTCALSGNLGWADDPEPEIAPKPTEIAAPQANAETLPAPKVPEIVEAVALPIAPPPLAKLWCGSAELGLSGAEGNSQNFKLRVGASAKRETPGNLFKFDLLYGYATADSILTEDRLISTFRDEILFPDKKWSVFGDGSVEYDQFKPFAVRLATHAGTGFQLIKNDATNLRGRVGFGVSREIDGPVNRFVPEGVVGYDFEMKIGKRQKLTSTLDAYPDVQRGNFRLIGKAAYEVLLCEEWNLSLKVGLLDRYDTSPSDGFKRNDIDYFAMILWKF